MIKSADELRETLKRYEYDEPVEPLSRIPSEAIRQALGDMRHVISRGAYIDLDTFGLANGGCTVCYAGGVLLARGYFTANADRAYTSHVFFQIDYPIRLASELFLNHSEADNIADCFNDARLGRFISLLCREGLDRAAAKRLQLEMYGAVPKREFAGALTPEGLEDMCQYLNAVADWLEAQGH